MAAGDHGVVGTMTANKIAVTDTVVVTNLNADQVDGADKDIDGTLAGNSDASVPTEKAVKTYVDAHKNTETAGTHGSTSAPTASKGVHRDAAGRAQVAAPSAAADIARKDTVDTHAALTVEGTHGSTVAATANRAVHRDAAGRAKVVAPAVAGDIALKETVDTHAALAVAGTHGSTVAATANKLIHRDAAGRAQVAAPAADADIARKDTPAVGVIETGASAVLKCKAIEIGDWNMDTTPTITKAHGIADYEKIRSIEVLIRADSDASFYALNKLDCLRSISGRVEIGQSDVSLLQLYRGSDGTSVFDDADFNATSYNRGWVTIWYEE